MPFRAVDKAYDAMTLRRWLKRRRIMAVIPSLATRAFPFPLVEQHWLVIDACHDRMAV